MANKSLTFDIFGRDRTASSAIKGVGSAAQGIQGAFLKLGGIIATVFASRAVIQFGEDSVKAFADAEKQQTKLTDALKRFPAVQGANLKALQAWNKELQKTSRFDDDAIAGAEAQLLQYGLTEDQLRKLTPLVLDYAARTGKDLATASEDVGKALLGQGRALKEVGINFKNTGDLAGNFEQLVAGLSAQVGGFAQTDLTTVDGKLLNLQNRFGDIQEQIGGALFDVISQLADEFSGDLEGAVQGLADFISGPGKDAVEGFINFLIDHKDDLDDFAFGIGTITIAMMGLNAAMSANPLGLVAIALAGIASGVYLAAVKFPEAGKNISSFFFGVLGLSQDIGIAIADFISGFINSITGLINGILTPLNTIRQALNLPTISIGKVDLSSSLRSTKAQTQLMADRARIYYTNKTPGDTNLNVFGGYVPQTSTPFLSDIPRMAEGGIVRATPGGVLANIGEGRYDEIVMPLSPDVIGSLSNRKIEINVNGVDGPAAVQLLVQRLSGGMAGL